MATLPTRIAKALGRAGGQARAAKLSATERSQSARKAAEARWAKDKKKKREKTK
jgi:hypothetical protein